MAVETRKNVEVCTYDQSEAYLRDHWVDIVRIGYSGPRDLADMQAVKIAMTFAALHGKHLAEGE